MNNKATDTDHIPVVFEKAEDRCFNQLSQSSVYREDTKTVSLTVCGGTYGGGVGMLDNKPKTPCFTLKIRGGVRHLHEEGWIGRNGEKGGVDTDGLGFDPWSDTRPISV